MQTRYQRERNGRPQYFKIKATLLTLALSTVLTGCGYGVVSSGTRTVIENTSDAKKSADVEWFNGSEIKKAHVSMSNLNTLTELKMDASELIPENDICTIRCVRLTSDEDIEDIRPVQALSPEKETILFSGEYFDGAGYYLGDGWYGFLIPNGYEKIVIRVGNTYFSV